MNYLIPVSLLGSFCFGYYSLNQGRARFGRKNLLIENAEEKESFQKLKTIFESVLKELNLEKDSFKLYIIERKMAQAFGNRFSSEKGVLISIAWASKEEDELRFIFKHEITHIQRNHTLKIPLYSFLTTISASSITTFSNISAITNVSSSIFILISSLYLVIYYTEREADSIACEQAAPKEILSRINTYKKKYITAHKKWKMYYKEQNNWRHYLYSDQGEYRLSYFFHPSIQDTTNLLLNRLAAKTI